MYKPVVKLLATTIVAQLTEGYPRSPGERVQFPARSLRVKLFAMVPVEYKNVKFRLTKISFIGYKFQFT